MSEVNKTIVENTTTHIDRIPPKMSVDEQGNVIWTPVYRDHNAAVFHRGKTVTNTEFNELFLKGAYQANYLSDTLKKFFNEHLNAAIFRSFTSGFDIVESFVKPFTTADWGAQQEDGYYYINIPAEEHGFIANDTAEVLERMSIATQMFLLGADDKFYEVSQVEIDTYNNVRLYTDDNTLSGVVIIKMNDKAYTLAGEKIDASFVQGLATVGISGKYADLVDTDAPGGPNPRLASLEDITQNILSGETIVPKAQQANVAERILSTSYIQGIKVSDIFETGSNFVKNATNAVNAENATNAINAEKINNIIIQKDTDNTLKVDGEIISRRKLIWAGNIPFGADDVSLTEPDIDRNQLIGKNLQLEIQDNSIYDGQTFLTDVMYTIKKGWFYYPRFNQSIEGTTSALRVRTTGIRVILNIGTAFNDALKIAWYGQLRNLTDSTEQTLKPDTNDYVLKAIYEVIN